MVYARASLFPLFLFLFVPLMAQQNIVPHVTRQNGGFVTHIILENQSVVDQSVTLQPYAESGAALTPRNVNLNANASRSISVQDVFSADALLVSHFTHDNDAVRAYVTYQSSQEPSTPAHVAQSEAQASRYSLFVGDWSVVFDGIAVVNTGDEAVDVWVAQRRLDGTVVKAVRAIQDLEPMAKGLYVIGAPEGSDFEAMEDAYFDVYADQKLAVTALRGTPPTADVGYLWASGTRVRSLSQATRDAQGVWFISDGRLSDVYEMMGYMVAQDRLWQVELYRRNALGRLAEIFGPDYVNQDIQARTTGYSAIELSNAFDDLDSESQQVIQAYVNGINRHIGEVNSNADLMPIEFLAVGLQAVSPWTAEDVLAWVALLQREFDPMDYGMGQLANAARYQAMQGQFPDTVGQMFEDFRFLNDPDAPTMIPPETAEPMAQHVPMDLPLRHDIDFVTLAQNMARDQQDRRDRLEAINALVRMGSYAWVVSGDKTASGNPILYSGPQMGFDVPSITTEGSIRGGGIEVSGMTVPGVPGIIVGRTPHHAWSMQVGHAHTCDVYIETPSALAAGTQRQETIHVAGAEDVEITVYRTAHGPVINQDPIVAWKYAHWDFEFDFVQANLGIIRAESMDEFGAAIELFAVSQHFCYADRDGNIAYWMSGRDPVRPEGEYRFPQGSMGQPLEYDIATRKPLAHDRNTSQGFYGGWNNKAMASYDNPPFGGYVAYGPFHRAHAVQDYLRTHDNLTFAQVRDLAINIAATDSFGGGGNPWQFVQNRFAAAVDADSTPEREAALDLLEAWDGHFVDGGEVRWINGTDRADAWILMDAWIDRVMDLSFTDELGFYDDRAAFQVLLHGLGETTLQNNYDWFTNLLDESAPQTADAIIVAALDDALTNLGAQPWGINQRGEILYYHPLPIFTEPVWRTPMGSRSTFAQCIEFGASGPIRIQSMFPLGQSGRITASETGVPQFHPMFFSMTPYFDAFAPRDFPLFD